MEIKLWKLQNSDSPRKHFSIKSLNWWNSTIYKLWHPKIGGIQLITILGHPKPGIIQLYILGHPEPGWIQLYVYILGHPEPGWIQLYIYIYILGHPVPLRNANI